MKRLSFLVLFFVFCFVFTDNCHAYIVIARERNAVIYGRGKIDKSDIQYEVHYDVDEEKGIIYRKEVNNFKTGEKIEDSTTYQIIENAIDISTGKKVIKAVGKPALGSLELVVMGDNFILSCRSTADYFVVTDMQRENVTKF